MRVEEGIYLSLLKEVAKEQNLTLEIIPGGHNQDSIIKIGNFSWNLIRRDSIEDMVKEIVFNGLYYIQEHGRWKV